MSTNPGKKRATQPVPRRAGDDNLYSFKLFLMACSYGGRKLAKNALVNAQMWHRRLVRLWYTRLFGAGALIHIEDAKTLCHTLCEGIEYRRVPNGSNSFRI